MNISYMAKLISAGLILSSSSVAVLAAGTPAEDAGKALFRQRCQVCHSVTPGQASRAAPNLYGVVGRKPASADYRYTPALKKLDGQWDAATLDAFLAAPTKVAPGTRMVAAVRDEKQRKAVIAYLKTLK